MKACPLCNSTYEDWIDFCFNDGVPLVVRSEALRPAAGAASPEDVPTPSRALGPAPVAGTDLPTPGLARAAERVPPPPEIPSIPSRPTGHPPHGVDLDDPAMDVPSPVAAPPGAAPSPGPSLLSASPTLAPLPEHDAPSPRLAAGRFDPPTTPTPVDLPTAPVPPPAYGATPVPPPFAVPTAVAAPGASDAAAPVQAVTSAPMAAPTAPLGIVSAPMLAEPLEASTGPSAAFLGAPVVEPAREAAFPAHPAPAMVTEVPTDVWEIARPVPPLSTSAVTVPPAEDTVPAMVPAALEEAQAPPPPRSAARTARPEPAPVEDPFAEPAARAPAGGGSGWVGLAAGAAVLLLLGAGGLAWMFSSRGTTPPASPTAGATAPPASTNAPVAASTPPVTPPPASTPAPVDPPTTPAAPPVAGGAAILAAPALPPAGTRPPEPTTPTTARPTTGADAARPLPGLASAPPPVEAPVAGTPTAPPPSAEPAVAEAAVPTGILRVESQPDGATVYLNGNASGTTPLALQLPLGSYSVRVVHSGYKAASAAADLRGGETRMPFFTLEPEASSGQVNVFGPVGFRVIVDGQDRGPSPVTVVVNEGLRQFQLIASDGTGCTIPREVHFSSPGRPETVTLQCQ